MTKKQLYILLFIILAATIVAPWIWSNDIKDGLALATTMLSGLCGLATFYIAILLYDRYGVESQTSQKSIEAINSLIQEMQKVNFILCYYPQANDDEAPNDYIIALSFRSRKADVIKPLSPEALSTLLYYKQSGMYGCVQLAEKARNLIYLPQSIMKAVESVSVFEYDPSELTKVSRPITTLQAFSDKLNATHETLDAESTYVPKTALSVVRFIDNYFSIRDSIVNWYYDNGVDINALNIEHTAGENSPI